MTQLGQIADKVRSKNAGPFWLTIDIFCGDTARFDHIVAHLSTDAVARMFDVPSQTIKRFDLADLSVITVSMPRPVVQGTRLDRDMHGAAWAALLSELDMPALVPEG
jgi:hypothetical protein